MGRGPFVRWRGAWLTARIPACLYAMRAVVSPAPGGLPFFHRTRPRANHPLFQRQVQNDTIMVNVKQEFSQVQNNFQQLVDKQHSQLEESVAQTRSFLGDKLAALEAQLEKTTEATDTLGAIGAELQGGHVSQERQLADIRKAIDATKRRIFEYVRGLEERVVRLACSNMNMEVLCLSGLAHIHTHDFPH